MRRVRSLRSNALRIAAAFVAVVGCSASDATASPRGALLAIARSGFPARYRFEDRGDAAPLTECFGPLATVAGVVDRTAGVSQILGPSGRTVAFLRPGGALVSRDVLPRWELPAPWMELDSQTPAATVAALDITLGPDLSSYVVARDLPPGPDRLADAVVRAGAHVASVESPSGGRRFVATLSETELAGLAPEDLPDDGSELRVEFDVDQRNRIVRVSVRPTSPGPDVDGETPLGWQVTYGGFDVATEMRLPSPSDVVNAAALVVPSHPTVFTTETCAVGA